MSEVMARVAFIGAGQMGMPMVRRLASTGHDVTVFARRQEVREECAALGTQSTDDVRSAVSEADVVVVCVFSDDQVRELAVGERGFLAAMPVGATLVVHTTGSPATVRDLADAGAHRQLAVIDAPVSGSAQDIADGRITVLLGGEPSALERVSGVLGAYCDPIMIIGPLGSALVVKLLNNALCAAHMQLAGEVERIASALGIEMAVVASAIQRSSGSSYSMGVVERFGSLEGVAAAAGHFLAKDLAVVNEVAAELDLDLGVLGVVNRNGPVVFKRRA